VFEPPIRPAKMSDVQRHQFVQKAKADRLAFDAAQFLSQGETDKATTLAGQCITIAGREQWTQWLRHYAITSFKIASRTVDEFLDGVPPANVAL
jgi:hypothetical protein